MNFSDAVRTDRAQALLDRMAGGWLRIYGGTRPAPGAATLEVPLLEWELPLDPPAAAAGVIQFALPTIQVDGDGDAAWARITDALGNWVIDDDVGLTDSGKLIELDNVELRAGAFVQVAQFRLVEP